MIFSISGTISSWTCKSALPFNLSETMVFLVYVFSRFIAKNERSQVHVVMGEVPRILRETLMLLKPLNGMHFNTLDIFYGRQSLLSNQLQFSTPVKLWDMENQL